jgi:hypothetical protein
VVALALAALIGGSGPAAARDEVSFEFFASNLEPYGGWHASAAYGQVWIPHLQVIGWHPYAYGHWVYTDFGWTWVSDYEWGAIPYHYGTWALDPELGWVWVPGYVWAPAWVVFRTGPSYIGWAPVPPSFSVGVSFGFADYGYDNFVFVREADFSAPDIHRFAVPIERSRVVFRDTTTVVNNIHIENDVVVNRGPDVRQIERVARAPVQRQSIERVERMAPVERVTRDALRVDPGRMEQGTVRAAERSTGERRGGPPAQRGKPRQEQQQDQPQPEQPEQEHGRGHGRG